MSLFIKKIDKINIKELITMNKTNCMNVIEDKNYKINNEELYDILDNLEYNEKNIEIENKGICPNCKKNDNIIDDYENGNMTCNECGVVISSKMDDNPEWRLYTNDDSKNDTARCNGLTSYFFPQSSLSTTISGTGRNKIKILQNWNSMPYKERSLYVDFKEIQEKCKLGNIMKRIEDDTKILWKKIKDSTHLNGKNKGKIIIIRGKNKRRLIAGTLIIACEKNIYPINYKEISDLFKITLTDVTMGRKIVINILKNIKMEYNLVPNTADKYIIRFCKSLHLKKEDIDLGLRIATNINRLNIASIHTAISIAAGSILLLADILDFKITKKIIAHKLAVSDVTISKAYKKVEKYREILVNDELTDKLVEILEVERNKLEIPNKLIEQYYNLNDIEPNIDRLMNDITYFNNYIEILLKTDQLRNYKFEREYKKIINEFNN